MATCTTATNMVGKKLTVGYATGCGDDVFTGKTYLPLGSINDKQLEFLANVDDNTSDTSGAFTSELAVNVALTLSVSGFLTTTDSALSAQNALVQYFFDEMIAERQPTVWLKVSGDGYPRVWHIFMIYKGSTEGHGTTATSTMSFDFGVTDTGATQPAVNLTAAP
jgi:hypothetical protein